MQRRDPPEVVELFQTIAALFPSAISLDKVIVRSEATPYANEIDFLSGDGAARYGGRWNRPGIRAVYASLDIITATLEAYGNIIEAGFSLANIRPRVTAGATMKLTRVLDLTERT